MSNDYDIILDIMRLAREQRCLLTDGKSNLTPSGSIVIVALSEKDNISATEIANSMGYEKPFVTHILKGLVAEEYVTVSRIDGRTVNVALTNKGKKVSEEIKDKLRKFVAMLFKDCDRKDVETFRQNIRKMVDMDKENF